MDLLGFLIAIIPIILSPGASFTLAMNAAIGQGMRGVARVIAGTALGILTHGVLSGIGVAGLLLHYPALMRLVTLLGTGYLFYLAMRLLYRGWRAHAGQPHRRTTARLATAYLANVLNIKAILLYITVVPLFAGVARDPLSFTQALSDTLLLAMIHSTLMALWLMFTAQMLIRASSAFSPLRMQRVIDIGGGILLLGLTVSLYC